MRFFGRVTPALLFLVALLSSCAENLPQDIPKNYMTPTEYTFAVPYDKAWKGTVRAVSEENRVRTLEKESGLIVTEYITVNKKVLTMFQTSLFGRTYKVSYSVNLLEESPGKTNVRIQANLMMEQFAVYNRERNVDWFEAYLRQDLFRKICQNLYQNEPQCYSVFPDYNAAARTCPPPQVTPAVEQESKVTATQVNRYSRKVVKDAQQALTEAGYEPGPVDGQIGARTRAALMEFQKANGISESGKLDQATLMALGL